MKNKMSLRNRIAFYFVTVTAFTIALLFLVIYTIVSNTVYTHLDGDLAAEYAEISSSILFLDDDLIFTNNFEWSEREHGQVEVNPTFIQVVDAGGKSLRKSVNLRDENLIFHPQQTRGKFYNLHIAGSIIRQIQAPLRSDDGRIRAYVIVAIPLEESARVLANLKSVLLISFPLILLFLYAVSRMIAGRIISPVNTVIDTAAQITRENMNARIPAPPRQDELHKLAETINNLLDRLQDAVLREKQFTANASHELRSPLAVIKGTLEVLMRKQRTPEQYREKIKYVIDEVNQMATLVDHLLSLARYESAGIQPLMGPVDLPRAVEKVMPHFGAALVEKKLAVQSSFQHAQTLTADAAMIEIILENLISNAIKYSAADSTIDLQTRRVGKAVELSITNFGAVIPTEQLENIFDRFYRVDQSRSSSIQGSGLGLAIVKRLMDLQGASITAESTPTSGTAFRMVFPRQA
jgi:heavy metal sensor kinase